MGFDVYGCMWMYFDIWQQKHGISFGRPEAMRRDLAARRVPNFGAPLKRAHLNVEIFE